MASKNPQPRQPGKTGKPKASAKPKPGDGLMGWLGRQVGHVKHAVQEDVTKPAKPKKAGQARQGAGSTGSTSSPRAGSSQATSPQAGSGQSQRPRPASRPAAAEPAPADPDAPSIIVYRQDKIEEAEMPHQPGVKLRRTIIDEVIVVKKKEGG